MNFNQAIDLFIGDRKAEGRINSRSTERSYRSVLGMLSEDVSNRDPRTIGREDIKRTLRRWAKPNSQRVARAIFVSMFDWAMEEGLRPDNPARQTPRPRKRPTTVYRLTREEAEAMLLACRTQRERRAVYLGLCAGLRNAELRGLQGRHFARDGWVWVSADIAKGDRPRWVPVLDELAPVVAEIKVSVNSDEYVLPSQRWRDPPINSKREDLKLRPSSSQALRTLVMAVAKRAGIKAHVHPHLLRHAFGDHVARSIDLNVARALLGHADVKTTQVYTGEPTLDELASAVVGFGFGDPKNRTQTPSARDAQPLPPETQAQHTGKAPTRIELVDKPLRLGTQDTEKWVSERLDHLMPSVRAYEEAFSCGS